MAAEWERPLAELKGDVKALDGRVDGLESAFTQHTKENRETHKDLYQRSERPSWLITWVLGGFMSATVGLAVYLFTRG